MASFHKPYCESDPVSAPGGGGCYSIEFIFFSPSMVTQELCDLDAIVPLPANSTLAVTFQKVRPFALHLEEQIQTLMTGPGRV